MTSPTGHFFFAYLCGKTTLNFLLRKSAFAEEPLTGTMDPSTQASQIRALAMSSSDGPRNLLCTISRSGQKVTECVKLKKY